MSNRISRKDRSRFFPHHGNINSERHVNDHRNPLNRRRLRIDPLKDGYDPDEDPTLDHDRKNDPIYKIPV